jgi:uncharacterized protein
MILVDANLLVYAHVSSTPQHAAAHRWLDARLNGSSQVGLPWNSLLAFVRLVSNPRIFASPLSVGGAWTQVESWLDVPVVWIPSPTERHKEILGRLLAGAGFRPNLVPDAQLSALAIEHGLTLCSADGDFARFPELRWENPLRG